MSEKPKNLSKDLQEIDNELQNLNSQKRKLKNELKRKSNYQYRKERTRRLIEIGALSEKYFELQKLTPSECESLFKTFSTFVKKNKPKNFQK
jgi:uncharacterized protein YukE